MFGRDAFDAGEVGYCAGDLADFIVGTGGKTELGHRRNAFAVLSDNALFIISFCSGAVLSAIAQKSLLLYQGLHRGQTQIEQ